MSDSSTFGTENPDAGDQDQQPAGSAAVSPSETALGTGGDAMGPAADGTDGSLGADMPTGDAGLADGGMPGGAPIEEESTGSASEGASADGRME